MPAAQPLAIEEKEQLDSSTPAEDNSGAFNLTSPSFKFLEIENIESVSFRDYEPVGNRIRADEDVDCIQRICQKATGKILSERQARVVRDCGDSLITNVRFDDLIAALKLLLVNCQLRAIPSVDIYDLNSSMAACVAHLRYLTSVVGSVSKWDEVNRRLAQIWIHIHFENHVNDLKENEKNGLPINRQGRAISTIARDSILQAFHGAQFVPQKADRDFLSDQFRWGKRWWKVAICMGIGLVLLAR